jgi:hypothetical protein
MEGFVMLRATIMMLAAGAALTMAAPADLDAQGRSNDRGVYQERRPQSSRVDTGPPFCRNGAGHPVHGRQWCVDKGFGLGGSVIWRRAGWDDVRIRRTRNTTGDVTRAVLIDILGDRVYRRFDDRRTALGVREPLAGRWVQDREGGLILELHAGGTPVARLLDRNRDGRVNTVYLNFGN